MTLVFFIFFLKMWLFYKYNIPGQQYFSYSLLQVWGTPGWFSCHLQSQNKSLHLLSMVHNWWWICEKTGLTNRCSGPVWRLHWQWTKSMEKVICSSGTGLEDAEFIPTKAQRVVWRHMSPWGSKQVSWWIIWKWETWGFQEILYQPVCKWHGQCLTLQVMYSDMLLPFSPISLVHNATTVKKWCLQQRENMAADKLMRKSTCHSCNKLGHIARYYTEDLRKKWGQTQQHQQQHQQQQ